MPSDPDDARSAPGRRAIAALYVGTVAVYSDQYVTQPVLPLLSVEFGVTPATAGLTISAVVLAIAIASTFYGPLSDALGRKRVMVWTTALLAIPTLACAAAPSLRALIALRGVQGVLIPGMSGVAVAYVGDAFDARRMRAVVGGYIAATVAGGLVGRVLSGWVAAHAGWRTAFVVFSATTLVGAVAMAIALPSLAPRARPRWGAAYGGMLRHLRDRSLLAGFLVGGTLFFGFLGIFTYLPYRLTAAPFSLGTGAVSTIYLVYVAGMIASPAAGKLSETIGQARLMQIGLAIAAAGALLSLAEALSAIVVALVVLCAGMFVGQAVAPSYVNQAAREAKGGASALYLGFYYLGATLGSVLPGLAWQRWRWPGVVASAVAAFAAGFAAITWLRGPRADAPPRAPGAPTRSA
jgi:YNFM family putative membrane transporter